MSADELEAKLEAAEAARREAEAAAGVYQSISADAIKRADEAERERDRWNARATAIEHHLQIANRNLKEAEHRAATLTEGLRKLVDETERCDHPDLEGVSSHDDVMIAARALLGDSSPRVKEGSE